MRIRHLNALVVPLLLGAASVLTAYRVDAEATPNPLEGLSIEKKSGRISVLIDGQAFTQYVYADTPKPYLHPIIGPTGARMTRAWPIEEARPGEEKDHPHHRSLWCAHGRVGGHDFWLENKNAGVIKNSKEPETCLTGGRSVDIDTASIWTTAGGKKVASDRTLIRMSQYSDKSRVIDYSTVITGQPNEPLVFGDTKEGMMAIRTHPALNLKGPVATGHCINSEGIEDLACWGKRAKWIAYWGVIDDKTCGVAVFDHPDNLRHPTWWHARDYGLVAANPFGIHDFEKKARGVGDFTLDPGKELALKYRFVFFEGTPQDADIKGKYEQWAANETPRP